MKFRLAMLAATLALSTAALAQPGAYFVWKHKTTGQTMCEPEADANWIKVSGPYEDSNCKIATKS